MFSMLDIVSKVTFQLKSAVHDFTAQGIALEV